ncbi:MAG TPA: multiheme c-type cytochrome [Pelovirga sp.]|nr:multiheme c-type cytochrome [Pelovirga sp.]
MVKVSIVSSCLVKITLVILVAALPLFAADDPLANQLVVEKQQFAPGSFDDPDNCLACHYDIYEQWSKSMHAYAWENKWYQDDYQRAHRETDGATDVFCAACHAPIAARTGQLPPHDGSQFDATSKRGISCDFCHTVTAIERTFNMGHVSAPGPMKYANRGDGESPYHGVVYSKNHTDAVFCGSCHNVKHPVTDVAVIDTYDDWLSGPYAEQGITCQNCHMTPTPGIGSNPGKSSPIGQERDNVAFHAFVGGSVIAQRNMGNEHQAQLAEEMLKAAAKLSLESKVTDNQLALTVHVDNVGAGHKIPTGVTYIRKMWLEVQLVDDNGGVIYSSGLVDDKNHVDPDAVFYRLLFKDSDGNLTGKSWLAVDIGYDRRIPAQGRDTEVYSIELPATGAYRADVRLMYRSLSQETLDFHEGDESEKIESIEMAKASVTLERS